MKKQHHPRGGGETTIGIHHVLRRPASHLSPPPLLSPPHSPPRRRSCTCALHGRDCDPPHHRRRRRSTTCMWKRREESNQVEYFQAPDARCLIMQVTHQHWSKFTTPRARRVENTTNRSSPGAGPNSNGHLTFPNQLLHTTLGSDKREAERELAVSTSQTAHGGPTQRIGAMMERPPTTSHPAGVLRRSAADADAANGFFFCLEDSASDWLFATSRNHKCHQMLTRNNSGKPTEQWTSFVTKGLLSWAIGARRRTSRTGRHVTGPKTPSLVGGHHNWERPPPTGTTLPKNS